MPARGAAYRTRPNHHRALLEEQASNLCRRPPLAAGKNYGLGSNGGVYVHSNQMITFGNYSEEYWNLGASNPNLPSIHLGSNDASWMKVWAGNNSDGCYRCGQAPAGS